MEEILNEITWKSVNWFGGIVLLKWILGVLNGAIFYYKFICICMQIILKKDAIVIFMHMYILVTLRNFSIIN